MSGEPRALVVCDGAGAEWLAGRLRDGLAWDVRAPSQWRQGLAHDHGDGARDAGPDAVVVVLPARFAPTLADGDAASWVGAVEQADVVWAPAEAAAMVEALASSGTSVVRGERDGALAAQVRARIEAVASGDRGRTDEPGWLRGVHGRDSRWRVWLARRPFHPRRLHELLQRGPLGGVARAKGWAWLPLGPDRSLAWSSVGAEHELRWLGRWWATRHPIWWPSEGAERAAIESRWAEPWGDRRQELACWGPALDDARWGEVVAALDGALLRADEPAPGAYEWSLDDALGLAGAAAWRSGDGGSASRGSN